MHQLTTMTASREAPAESALSFNTPMETNHPPVFNQDTLTSHQQQQQQQRNQEELGPAKRRSSVSAIPHYLQSYNVPAQQPFESALPADIAGGDAPLHSLEHEAAEVLTTLSQGRRFSQASMASTSRMSELGEHPSGASSSPLHPAGGQFIHRMGSYPIIHQAISHLSQLYESSRQSSPAVRYSADTLHSSFSTMAPYLQALSQPLQPALSTIDQYATDQLTKFESACPSLVQAQSAADLAGVVKGQVDAALEVLETRLDHLQPSQSVEAVANAPGEPLHRLHRISGKASNTVKSILRYPLSTTATKETTSEEVMNTDGVTRLHYVLQSLRTASSNIEAQTQLILNTGVSMLQHRYNGAPPSDASNPPMSRPFSSSHYALMSGTKERRDAAKREIAETLKKVVDDVSKYANGLLPNDARALVRQVILRFPERWQSRTGPPSPSSSNNGPSRLNGGDETTRLLAFAGEASSMVFNIASIFAGVVERASADWMPLSTAPSATAA